MVGPDSKITTDSTEMLSLLAEHWSQVFSDRPVNAQLMSKWLDEENAALPLSSWRFLAPMLKDPSSPLLSLVPGLMAFLTSLGSGF